MAFTPYSSLAPVTVTVAGTVAVTGALTDAQLRATPVPVSGTVAVSGVAGTVLVDGSAVTQPISAASLPLPTGAAKDSTLTDSSQRVGGTVAVTGPLTDTQLRATPVPISGTVATGGLTDTQLRATPVPVSGTVAVSALAGTVDVSDRVGRLVGVVSGTVAATQGTSPWVTGGLTDAQLRASAVPVDASGVPVPVTGPLTDTQLRASAVAVDGSAVTQPVSADSLPLPDGAATEDTLERASESLNDVGLTAILEREKIPA